MNADPSSGNCCKTKPATKPAEGGGGGGGYSKPNSYSSGSWSTSTSLEDIEYKLLGADQRDELFESTLEEEEMPPME